MQTKTPDRMELITQLARERNFLQKHKIDSTEVRLCVTESGEWWCNYGDVLYDTVHTVFCGSSLISRYDHLDGIRETADDLISQVDDQIAESES